MRPLLSLFSLPAAVAVLSGVPGGRSGAPPRSDDYYWSGVLAPGQRVEIKEVFGTIHAEATDGREVEVTAARHEAGGRDAEVRVETVRHDEGVTICVVYPGERGRPANECNPGGGLNVNNPAARTRYDFTVRVPRGVSLRAHTVEGDVIALGLPADADVGTVEGRVEVSAAGVVQASSVEGPVHARTGVAAPGEDLHLSSVDGNVVLEVPASFRADLHASQMSGSFVIDPVLARRSELRTTRDLGMHATTVGPIGGGGHLLRMSTIDGDLEIHAIGRGG